MILEQKLAFVDIETTGFDRDTQEIVELGVVIAELKAGVLTVVDQLAASLEDAMKSFVDKTKNAVFLAHNITFDYPFIEKALKDCELENELHFHKIDTLSVAFAKLHDKEDINHLSLRKLCEYFGVENKNAHTAFADAYATYEVFKKLMNLK